MTTETAAPALPKAPRIYQALIEVMRDTNAIAKGRKNQEQKFMFRGIDDIYNELHASMAKAGVFILPEVIDYTLNERTTSRGTQLYYTRAKIRHHFVADDGSEVTTTTVGEAMDTGDKGFNKAMSISLKYALLQMLLIPTDDVKKDPDATTPAETLPMSIRNIINTLDPERDGALIGALMDIEAAKSRDALLAVYNAHPELRENPTFTRCLTAQKKQI
ncbi:MAG: ERF family protein [Pseudoflavonifractor sp.]|nr:ERF family protein [Alloprevotella sp.]MCM1117622.1 ERF family protein [Pseudoflavonifractor sp.]